MSSLRRTLAVLVVLAGCVGLFSACGSSGRTNSPVTPSLPIQGAGAPETPGASSGAQGFASGTQTISIDVYGTNRTAVLSVPTNVSHPAPLLFAFHGHGGTGAALDRQMGFEKLWPQAIVAYPDGLTGHATPQDPRGLKTGWQGAAGQGGDADIAFYDALLSDLEAKLPVDRSRIYLMGHSNGSYFVSLLRNERGQAIAATANSSGQPTRLIHTDPVRSMFMSMGQFDATVPYAQQKKAVPVAAAHLGVDPATAKAAGFLTTETGPNGIELAVYDYPAGHRPPPELPGLLVAFFQRHTLPSA